VPHALIIGGTGLVGRAVARRLLADGWTVTVTGRDPAHLPADVGAAGARFVRAEPDDPAALGEAAGDGADLLVACICYTAAQARLLLPLARHATSTVMISSKAVYVDDAGRHSNSDTPPRFGGPVTEEQPTMSPGTMDYNSREGYGANKVAAEQVLLDSGVPVTVLRPSKIHGQGARIPNSRIIAALVGHTWREVLLDDDAPPGLGRHPWHRLPPFILDMGAAAALGYQPVGDYATTVTDEVHWLVERCRVDGAAKLPPELDERFFVD
jgi:nucleoside-diphosphate-sugar epimerase